MPCPHGLRQIAERIRPVRSASLSPLRTMSRRSTSSARSRQSRSLPSALSRTRLQVLQNGSEIGEDSIVAAGTLVPEEKKFPARSLLMGRPAALKRELTGQEVASIRDYADRYVGYRKDYMSASAEK